MSIFDSIKYHVGRQVRSVPHTVKKAIVKKTNEPHEHATNSSRSRYAHEVLDTGTRIGRANAAAISFKERMEKANRPRGDPRFQ